MAQIPENVKKFIKIISEDDRVRTLQGLCKHYPEIYVEINTDPNRNGIEDIIDGCNIDYASVQNKTEFAKLVEEAFGAYYPDPEPKEIGDIRNYCVRLKEMPESYDALLNVQIEKKIPAEKKGGKPTIVKIPMTEEYPVLVGEYGPLLRDALHSGIDKARSGAAKDWKKNFGVGFNEITAKLFPKPSNRFIRDDLSDGGQRENLFIYDACAALLKGDFTRLDPVIGDEACEERPPIVIDLWEALTDYVQNVEDIKVLLQGYLDRHKDDEDRVSSKVKFASDSDWSNKFITVCSDFAKSAKLDIPVFDYLKSCYANTTASVLAADEWGMASFDRDRAVYDANAKENCREMLSVMSVTQMQRMAVHVVKSGKVYGRIFEQIIEVLNRIKATKKDALVKSLPIYEVMRTVLAYEYVKERPIILTVHQIRCTPNGDMNDPECTATYDLVDIDTYYYKPQSGKFHAVPLLGLSDNEKSRPCVAIQAYHVVTSGNIIPNIGDGLDFSALGDGYRDVIAACDLSLLVQCYAAIHPIFAGEVILEDSKVLDMDSSLEYMNGLYGSVFGTEGTDWDEAPTRRSALFKLAEPQYSLAAEYNALRRLAIACGLVNKQYIKRLLGNQWAKLKKKTLCARSLDSCAFSIHHINTNSLNNIIERNRTSLGIKSLGRFHEFDSKQSYQDLSGFK